MIDSLLRARGLRTGRFTSPHVESMTERISARRRAADRGAFVAAYPTWRRTSTWSTPTSAHPLSFFETWWGWPGRLRRRPRRRRRVEVGHGRHLGRDQRRRRRGRGDHPDRGRPRPYLGDQPAEDRGREGRDHQARRRTWSSPSRTPRCWPSSPPAAARSAPPLLVEGVDFGVVSRSPAVGGQMRRPCRAFERSTPTSSCRCSAPTRPRTRCSPWRRWSACSARTRCSDEIVREAFAEVTLTRAAGDHPARPDDPAGRGPQPARRRGGRRGDPRLLHLRPAGRGASG